MKAITDYTSYDSVRAILGVDSIELPDSVLATDIFASALQRTLKGYVDLSDKSLYTYFSEIDAAASMTESQELLYDTICEYAAYIVAEVCCTSLSMFTLKSDSDGKATQTRFSSESVYKDVVANIRERLVGISGHIDTLIGSSSDAYSFTGVYPISPDTDRVTNS